MGICSHEPKFKRVYNKNFLSHVLKPPPWRQPMLPSSNVLLQRTSILPFQKKTAKLGVFFYAIHILFTNICFQRFFIDIYTEYYMCLLNTVFALHRNNSEWFLFLIWKNLKSWETNCCLVPKLCPTLCDHMDCSPPGSSVHGILQARILEWVVSSFSRGSSRPRDLTQVSHIVGRRFNLWTTRKPWHIGVSYYSGGIVLLCFGVPRAILTLKDYLEWFVRAWNSFVQRFITQL